jgi:conflict system STAND superfamily ATPase
MIVGPAERAGLAFDEGLPGRILAETREQPGALPLLAYTLDELYHASGGSPILTYQAYNQLGGVHGAIGNRAEAIFQHELGDATRAVFESVFRELVGIDSEGRVTRRRTALRNVVQGGAPAERFVHVFTAARLLVLTRGPTEEAVVEVAHEALFTSWPRLRDWIQTIEADLRLLEQIRAAAREWNTNARDEAYLWPQGRLEPVPPMLARLQPNLERYEHEFIEPEDQRLFATFNDAMTDPLRRQRTADRLISLGESTLPGFCDSLANPSADIRRAAEAAIVRFGRASVPALIALSTDENPVSQTARLSAASALLVINLQLYH